MASFGFVGVMASFTGPVGVVASLVSRGVMASFGFPGGGWASLACPRGVMASFDSPSA